MAVRIYRATMPEGVLTRRLERNKKTMISGGRVLRIGGAGCIEPVISRIGHEQGLPIRKS